MLALFHLYMLTEDDMWSFIRNIREILHSFLDLILSETETEMYQTERNEWALAVA